jgi:RNA polymerase sigma-70 factor (ECF subfamily)
MQESFLDAFRKIHSYSGDGSFGGWLRRIVVNNSLDALRKRKNELSLDEERIEIPDIEDKYDENINYRADEIKNAIKNLSDDDRIIISLFLFEGYDHDEISQILSISNNTSRTRYSRAKKRLLRRLTVSRAESIFNLN